MSEDSFKTTKDTKEMAHEAIEMLRKASRYERLARNEVYLEVHGEKEAEELLKESAKLKEKGDEMLQTSVVESLRAVSNIEINKGEKKWKNWNSL